jgi:hypothetical protein
MASEDLSLLGRDLKDESPTIFETSGNTPPTTEGRAGWRRRLAVIKVSCEYIE